MTKAKRKKCAVCTKCGEQCKQDAVWGGLCTLHFRMKRFGSVAK